MVLQLTPHNERLFAVNDWSSFRSHANRLHCDWLHLVTLQWAVLVVKHTADCQ